MERDTASLVTGKEGGRENGSEECRIETAEKRIGAKIRTQVDGQIERWAGRGASDLPLAFHACFN